MDFIWGIIGVLIGTFGGVKIERDARDPERAELYRLNKHYGDGREAARHYADYLECVLKDIRNDYPETAGDVYEALGSYYIDKQFEWRDQ